MSAGEPDETTTASTTPAAAAGPAALPRKTTLTVDVDVLDDAKNGFWFSLGLGKYVTFADYVTAALRSHNEMIRNTYNEGQPFPVRPTTNLPKNHVK